MKAKTIPPSFAAQNPPPFTQGRLEQGGENPSGTPTVRYLPLLGEAFLYICFVGSHD